MLINIWFQMKKTIGKRVRFALKRANVSASQLAMYMNNRNEGNLSKQINCKGGRHLTYDDVKDIGKFLNISYSWLVGDIQSIVPIPADQEDEYMAAHEKRSHAILDGVRVSRLYKILSLESMLFSSNKERSDDQVILHPLDDPGQDVVFVGAEYEEFFDDILWYIEARLKQYIDRHRSDED